MRKIVCFGWKILRNYQNVQIRRSEIKSFDELIYNNPLYLHPSKRSYLKSKKKKRKTVEYRRIDFFLQKGMGMNLSNHGGAGGNFCNGGTMVNGCWSAHSSLAQARSLGQPSRTSSFEQNGIDIQSYPSIRCHWVFANHRWITNEPCVTSDRCRGTRSNGDALENTPSSIFWHVRLYQTFLWSHSSMLVTSNLRSSPSISTDSTRDPVTFHFHSCRGGCRLGSKIR